MASNKLVKPAPQGPSGIGAAMAAPLGSVGGYQGGVASDHLDKMKAGKPTPYSGK